jgi:hypothetical protein
MRVRSRSQRPHGYAYTHVKKGPPPVRAERFPANACQVPTYRELAGAFSVLGTYACIIPSIRISSDLDSNVEVRFKCAESSK